MIYIIRTCTWISYAKAMLQPIYFPNLYKKTRPSVRILIIYENRLMDTSVLLFQGEKLPISLVVLRKMHKLFEIHK